MKIIIEGRTPSKKNSRVIICRGKKPILLPSENYKAWHKQAWIQVIPQVRRNRLITKCKITILFYAPDKRKADLTNKTESIMDLLVDMGVLKDDNWYIANDVHMIFVGVDKERPRAEITIKYE